MIAGRIMNGIRRRIGQIVSFLPATNAEPPMVSSHTLPDDQFLRLFRLDEIDYHLNREDIASAKAALLAYYQQRTDPPWPIPSGTLTDLRLELGTLTQDDLILKADKLLELKVTPDEKQPEIDSKGDIDWAANLTSTPEWLYRLNRHGWWPVLGLAYELTGDERYAEVFVKQLLHWVKECPPPSNKSEKSPHWRLMETALRMRVSWIPCFAIFSKSRHFSDEAKFTMLRSIYDHGRYLSLFKSRLNHLLREINGLASVSIYFPEFSEAQTWLEVATQRLASELKTQINNDGSHIEVSTGYQWLVLDELEATYDLLRDNFLHPIVKQLEVILNKMYTLLALVIRPDWTFPEINDGFLRWNYRRMERAAKKFKRNDLLFIGSAGKEGLCPKQCSVAFDDAGWYVMRSGWDIASRYLFFDAGPHGGNHGHEDKLSIEVYAFGQPFIVDCGSYTYEKTDPFRTYFVGSQGHNTVIVNGLSQIRRWIEKPPYAQPKHNRRFATWVSDDNCDYVSSYYDGGYAAFSLDRPKKVEVIKDVRHTRHVLFIKPDYWLLIDELEATHNYSYEILFHAPPGISVREVANKQVILSKSDDHPGLRIIPVDYGIVDVSWLSGNEAPIQGWYSVDHMHKVPSNTVTYRCDNRRSVLLMTLLIPYQAGRRSESVAVEPIAVKGGHGKAIRVVLGDAVDYLMFSKEADPKQFGGHESCGCVCLIRTDNYERETRRFELSEIR